MWALLLHVVANPCLCCIPGPLSPLIVYIIVEIVYVSVVYDDGFEPIVLNPRTINAFDLWNNPLYVVKPDFKRLDQTTGTIASLS